MEDETNKRKTKEKERRERVHRTLVFWRKVQVYYKNSPTERRKLYVSNGQKMREEVSKLKTI